MGSDDDRRVVSAGPRGAIRFDVFEVDLDAGELRRDGGLVPLQDLPFRLLAALLEQPRRVVTREALRRRLWNDTIVDVDAGLNTAVRKLREALGDNAEEPRFLETLPRRGYRLNVSFDPPENRRPAESVAAGPAVSRVRRLSAVTAGFVLVAGLMAIAFVAWRTSCRDGSCQKASGSAYRAAWLRCQTVSRSGVALSKRTPQRQPRTRCRSSRGSPEPLPGTSM